MTKLIRVMEIGSAKPTFVNFDNVRFIKSDPDGVGTAIVFSPDHRLFVNEKPEALASVLAAAK